MYLITENGDRLTVDNSSVNYDVGFHPWYQTVAIIDDDTAYLKDVWVIELQNYNGQHSENRFEMEWYKDLYFNHEPSKDEIMAAIIRSGGTPNTIAFVKHGYVIDRDYD